MALKKMEETNREERFNRIKKPTNYLFHIILGALALLSIIPFLFVIIISITDEKTLVKNGYRFIPEKLSYDSSYGSGYDCGIAVNWNLCLCTF